VIPPLPPPRVRVHLPGTRSIAHLRAVLERDRLARLREDIEEQAARIGAREYVEERLKAARAAEEGR
jgi:hypothetical protein